MAMLILCGSKKGGTGKSTLAVHLAIERTRKGHTVLLIDADAQATAFKWITRRNNSNIEPQIVCERAVGWEEITGLAEREYNNFETIIIDVAGRDSEEMRRTLAFVDVLISPIAPTMNDLDTAEEMHNIVGDFLGEAKTGSYPLKKAYFIISKASPNPFLAQTVRDAQEFLASFNNLTTSHAVIYTRAAFEKASVSGASVTELTPSDQKAAQDISKLYKEIFHD